MIYDFLTNAQYGAGFDPAAINLTTLYGAGGDASLQTYCQRDGHRGVSPLLSSPEQGSSILVALAADCSIARRCGRAAQLKFIPYGDLPISSGP